MLIKNRGRGYTSSGHLVRLLLRASRARVSTRRVRKGCANWLASAFARLLRTKGTKGDEAAIYDAIESPRLRLMSVEFSRLAPTAQARRQASNSASPNCQLPCHSAGATAGDETTATVSRLSPRISVCRDERVVSPKNRLLEGCRCSKHKETKRKATKATKRRNDEQESRRRNDDDWEAREEDFRKDDIVVFLASCLSVSCQPRAYLRGSFMVATKNLDERKTLATATMWLRDSAALLTFHSQSQSPVFSFSFLSSHFAVALRRAAVSGNEWHVARRQAAINCPPATYLVG